MAIRRSVGWLPSDSLSYYRAFDSRRQSPARHTTRVISCVDFTPRRKRRQTQLFSAQLQTPPACRFDVQLRMGFDRFRNRKLMFGGLGLRNGSAEAAGDCTFAGSIRPRRRTSVLLLDPLQEVPGGILVAMFYVVCKLGLAVRLQAGGCRRVLWRTVVTDDILWHVERLCP